VICTEKQATRCKPFDTKENSKLIGCFVRDATAARNMPSGATRCQQHHTWVKKHQAVCADDVEPHTTSLG
jgi:hypothetical protein